MTEGRQLRVESQATGAVCYLRLSGSIDETFEPDMLLSEAFGRTLILNMKGVSRFSSIGVREWVVAMGQLSQKFERLFLAECSVATVNYLNMVANFRGTAQVMSVQLPFYCEMCSLESEVLHQLQGSRDASVPSVTCDRCGSQMVFDGSIETYLAFRAKLEESRSGPTPHSVRPFSALGDDEPNDSPSGPQVPASGDLYAPSNGESSPRPQLFDTARPVESEARTPTRDLPPSVRVPAKGTLPDRGAPSQAPLPRAPSYPKPSPIDHAPPSWAKRIALFGAGGVAAIALSVLAWWLIWGDTGQQLAVYREHLARGRYGMAAAVIGEFGPNDRARLQAEILESALAQYREHLQAKHLDEAEALVSSLEAILQEELTRRLREELALARYRDHVLARRFKEAEALLRRLQQMDMLRLTPERPLYLDISIARIEALTGAEQFSLAQDLIGRLEKEGVITAERGKSLRDEIERTRERVVSAYRQAAAQSFQAERYEAVVSAATRASTVAPLDAEFAFIAGESHRLLGRNEEAEPFFATYIDAMVNSKKFDKRVDETLSWQASRLAAEGRVEEAQALLRRVLASTDSAKRSASARLLRELSSRSNRR